MSKTDLTCNICRQPLTVVQSVKPRASDSGPMVSVLLASTFYECPAHGLYRIFSNGMREWVRRNA